MCGRGGRKKFDKSGIQCYDIYEDFADECYSKSNGDEAKMAQEEKEKEEILQMAIEEEDKDEETLHIVTTKDEGNNGDTWFLDTGCSTHMSRRRGWFVELDYSIKSRVKFVDDKTMNMEGVGNVMIKKKDGSKFFIAGVLYVPDMKSNLLSIANS